MIAVAIGAIVIGNYEATRLLPELLLADGQGRTIEIS